MTYLTGVRNVAPPHRLFDFVHSQCVIIDALYIAGMALQGAKIAAPNAGSLVVECIQVPVQIRLPCVGPFWGAFHNIPNVAYAVGFEPRQPIQHGGFQTAGFIEIVTFTISQLFVAFYERHRESFRRIFGDDIDQRPELFRFAWAVRNAMSHHGGAVNITDPKVRPVRWYNQSYDYRNAGTKIIGPPVMTFGDILVLLFEISDELDRLGCPPHP